MSPNSGNKKEKIRFGFSNEIESPLWKIYDGLAAVGVAAVHLGGLFHSKLRLAVKGRVGGIRRWKISVIDDRKSILIHAASRGEFEAILPLIDRLRENDQYRIAISFSSPSVEKAIMNLPGIWAAGYLPFDQLGDQLRFLSRLEPSLILVAKHDIWPNMIRASAMLEIPYIILNGNFHPRTRRLLPFVRKFNRDFFGLVTEVWPVSKRDAERIEPLLPLRTPNIPLGDTRYDRTLNRLESGASRFSDLKSALGGGPVIVAGSTWPPEEEIIFPAFAAIIRDYPTAKLVIAPHELGPRSLKRIRKRADKGQLSITAHSSWMGEPVSANVYYIDTMGLLADIYSVGWAAVVGGGFGKGVHSVLEPAVYRLPVSFGPRHHVSHEASLLLASGGGNVLTSSSALETLWRKWLEDPATHNKVSTAAFGVVTDNAGATERVIERLRNYLEDESA